MRTDRTRDPGPKYHRAMARMMALRGYHGLGISHVIALLDDPPGCECPGCRQTRRDAKREPRG